MKYKTEIDVSVCRLGKIVSWEEPLEFGSASISLAELNEVAKKEFPDVPLDRLRVESAGPDGDLAIMMRMV